MVAILSQEYVFIPLICAGVLLFGYVWKKLGGSLNPINLFKSDEKPKEVSS